MCTVKDVHKKDGHTLESSCKVLESGAKEKRLGLSQCVKA